MVCFCLIRFESFFFLSKWIRTIEIIDFFFTCVSIPLEIRIPNNNKTIKWTQREMSGNEYEMGILYTRAHFVSIWNSRNDWKCSCSYGNGQTITKTQYTLFTVVKHEYISAAQTKYEEVKNFGAKETTQYSHRMSVDASFGHIVQMFHTTTAVIVWNSLFSILTSQRSGPCMQW